MGFEKGKSYRFKDQCAMEEFANSGESGNEDDIAEEIGLKSFTVAEVDKSGDVVEIVVHSPDLRDKKDVYAGSFDLSVLFLETEFPLFEEVELSAKVHPDDIYNRIMSALREIGGAEMMNIMDGKDVFNAIHSAAYQAFPPSTEEE